VGGGYFVCEESVFGRVYVLGLMGGAFCGWWFVCVVWFVGFGQRGGGGGAVLRWS